MTTTMMAMTIICAAHRSCLSSFAVLTSEFQTVYEVFLLTSFTTWQIVSACQSYSSLTELISQLVD